MPQELGVQSTGQGYMGLLYTEVATLLRCICFMVRLGPFEESLLSDTRSLHKETSSAIEGVQANAT